jgi:hypothetical protein
MVESRVSSSLLFDRIRNIVVFLLFFRPICANERCLNDCDYLFFVLLLRVRPSRRSRPLDSAPPRLDKALHRRRLLLWCSRETESATVPNLLGGPLGHGEAVGADDGTD